MNLVFLVQVTLVLGGCVAVWCWLRVMNSPRGERYLKDRMQGPFVPLDKEQE